MHESVVPQVSTSVQAALAPPPLADLSAPLPGGWLGQQLQRLQRLLALRDAHVSHLNDEGRRLLDHAIFTTFVDCRELGGETLAAALLTTLQTDTPVTADDATLTGALRKAWTLRMEKNTRTRPGPRSRRRARAPGR